MISEEAFKLCDVFLPEKADAIKHNFCNGRVNKA
jgi:hypothetical protein